MANPLTDPNDWVDQESNSPPSQWDGVAYEWLGVFGVGQPAQFIEFTGDLNSIPESFAVSVSTGSEAFSVPHVLVVSWGSGGDDVRALTPETTEEFTFEKPEGAISALVVQVTSDDDEYPYAYSMDVAVTPIAAVDPPAPCEEIGRVTRAFVSAHHPDRIHYSNIVRGAKRCLVADFNGAIPPARTIASATWRCDFPGGVAMSNAQLGERDTSVTITAIYGCEATLKCEATLDNGEVYPQLFVVNVREMPYFSGEPSVAAGASELTVTA